MTRCVILSTLCLLLPLSGCIGLAIPPASRLDTIIVDMPHGAWRLHLYPDGSGAYSFGALPELGGIPAETFDFYEQYDELSGRITDDREPGREYGTVQFCVEGRGCGELFYLYDREYADELFDRAFANRSGRPARGGLGDTEVIDQMWRQRDAD